MRRLWGVLGCLALALFAASLLFGSAGRAARQAIETGPLASGVVDPPAFTGAQASLSFGHVRRVGATAVRLIVFWDQVAPRGTVKPAGFDAADPASPSYRWDAFDEQIRLAATNQLDPIVGIQSAPAWAERGKVGEPGTRNPDPGEFALFARAAALRYSGTFADLPRVRYWQVWNEPNLVLFLTPTSPDLYRQLVNEMAAAVKSVRADNVVVAGGTSPFGSPGVAVAPLEFMRRLLCVAEQPPHRATCSDRIRFDVWTHHPYTSGGPRRQALRPDDVSLGDLPEMRRVLEAAISAGHVVSSRPIRFWVTEFSWDTNPPDPKAVPAALHARWVAEALHQMWRSGVSMVVWFQLSDEPLRTSMFQSGLFYDAALSRPKPALRAFRFPFVALPDKRGIVLWGRTPEGQPARVTLQRRVSGRWRTIGSVRTTRYGIFTLRVRSRSRAPFRARLAGGEASLPFAAGPTRNLDVWPFGCGGILPC